jgi:GNAT superfamily N-acetyltransferase
MDTLHAPKTEIADAARDGAAIAPLLDAYRMFYGEPSDPAAALEFIEERFAKRDTQFFVTRAQDGTLLGFAHLLLSLDTLSLRPIGILEDIYVAEAARGQGVGGALLDAAETYAREHGLARLTLSTAHKNRTAQRLYLSKGYVPDQRFRSFNRFLGDIPAAEAPPVPDARATT